MARDARDTRAEKIHMTAPEGAPFGPGGVLVGGLEVADGEAARTWADLLTEAGFVPDALPVVVHRTAHGALARLHPQTLARLTPGHETLDLRSRHPDLRRGDGGDLRREILLALLAAPVPLAFPDIEEFASALRMREDIATAAARTVLDFGTREADRPHEWWAWREDAGFVLRPGAPIAEALRQATQPPPGGRRYSFSCYRATEYVILLGIAQELARSNPDLLAALQARWERAPIQSGRFHDVFLRETGTNADPLPERWYVPGDRVWFRNPDETSSDVAGYEGSWTFYLGDGRFANLWKPDAPFTFEGKCVELYHWRDAVVDGPDGEPAIDEARVEALVARTLGDPAARARALAATLRLRDPKGVRAGGGCLDTTREAPRWVRPGTADLVLPPA